MSTKLAAKRLSPPIEGIVATFLVLVSAQVLASSGIDRQCPTLAPRSDTTLLEPAYRIDAREVEAAAAADTALAEEDSDGTPHIGGANHSTVASRRLIEDLMEQAEHRTATTENSKEQLRKTGLPPTATRLPGIDDEDLPRFRRHMFRTDI